MMKKQLTALLSFGLLVSGSIEVKADGLEPIAITKDKFTLNLQFDLSHLKQDCGLRVDWGDTSTTDIRVGRDVNENDFFVQHTYRSDGSYPIKIEGKTIFRGLGTVPPCPGEFLTTGLIDHNNQQRLKKERELAKEKEMRAKQEALQAQLKLEQEKREKELANRLQQQAQAQALELQAELEREQLEKQRAKRAQELAAQENKRAAAIAEKALKEKARLEAEQKAKDKQLATEQEEKLLALKQLKAQKQELEALKRQLREMEQVKKESKLSERKSETPEKNNSSASASNAIKQAPEVKVSPILPKEKELPSETKASSAKVTISDEVEGKFLKGCRALAKLDRAILIDVDGDIDTEKLPDMRDTISVCVTAIKASAKSDKGLYSLVEFGNGTLRCNQYSNKAISMTQNLEPKLYVISGTYKSIEDDRLELTDCSIVLSDLQGSI